MNRLNLRVAKLGNGDLLRWNEFVFACPEAGFFHRAEWRSIIENVFGWRTHFLYAENGAGVQGVLPLAEVKGRLIRHALISLPYCVQAGIVAANETASDALDAAAQALAADLDVDYLEYRSPDRAHTDWPCDASYALFKSELSAATAYEFSAIPGKRRAMVRKAQRISLRSEIDDDITRFYRAYSDSVRRLGTPVYPRRYFAALKAAFGPDCEIMAIQKDSRTIATAMSFLFRGETTPYYAGGTEAARALAGNDFMYWELLGRAAQRGLHTFNAGRGRLGTGSSHFKTLWGFKPQPLHYEYQVRRGLAPINDPKDPRYRLFIKLWRRLPLTLANALGPRLSRNLC
ncbi:MAG: FemAB family PEP-CTERM system-associated protein [Burkholderiales bacterium]|nr:FemAB family PEP-CTERM system-associated protein [Burkholderiales bacterium]